MGLAGQVCTWPGLELSYGRTWLNQLFHRAVHTGGVLPATDHQPEVGPTHDLHDHGMHCIQVYGMCALHVQEVLPFWLLVFFKRNMYIDTDSLQKYMQNFRCTHNVML